MSQIHEQHTQKVKLEHTQTSDVNCEFCCRVNLTYEW